MKPSPRLLIAEGNPKDRRELVLAGGGGLGSMAYTQSIRHICPDAHIDVMYPADHTESLPAGTSFDDYDGFIIGGSGLNIPLDGDNPQIANQVELARVAFKSKIPFLGSCWGLQVAAVAAGGIVDISPRGREMGFARKIALTPEGQSSAFFEGKSRAFDSAAIHFDEVTHLPAGSVVLAENSHTRIQAATIRYEGGTFWGLQYHPEFDLAHMAGLIRSYATGLVEDGFYADEASAQAHATDMELLHQDPSREDLAWLLGVDQDILNPDVRLREVANWVDQYVMPRSVARG